MSLEADIRRDNPYSPFEANYKFLNPGTPRSDADLFETSFKAPSTISMLPQPHRPLPEQHPWSDMVFDVACMPLRQMSPGISLPSASPNSSMPTPPLYSGSTVSSAFSSRTSSMCSDQPLTLVEATRTLTHDHLTFNLSPSKKSKHSDLDLPPLAPDSPVQDSLVPSDTLRNSSMDTTLSSEIYSQLDLQGDDLEADGQDMSDHFESTMDVDSNESNDEGDDEAGSFKDSDSRESSSMGDISPVKGRATRSSARAATRASKSKPPAKTSTRAKKNVATKAAQAPQKIKTTLKNAGRASSMGSKSPTSASDSSSSGSISSSSSRKHSSAEEESPEAKRQKFLERNRMAASKCREKKRLQTLKTIADADAITARNQALHELQEELQEEVRTLKNQILCHRDCGCDVIQKFVQSSFGAASIFAGPAHAQIQAQVRAAARPHTHML
ncbi:hypothetical protein BX616_007481 [Lobosporangium transversale]|uniref:BZIP domain-containing protein n=1 Tax=Lobosporangium transversale TaxID=64571 RepID=A0A1Y2GJ86_9FUNG|nr:hypothetical protein BCR41DRAFT_357034 [Lobosporangium transversale]KAF9918607.1 hypothetical protein BX616_007481 [Lobosporangium transversale]ORZ11325.1 hypothetical protein BCR41DRAFT_357034 [Lobosporangium transversale]|eukprot:XP_021879640.1 hypothetical protein BCR41DRAFT_357034 [Lobosporangium transversale]